MRIRKITSNSSIEGRPKSCAFWAPLMSNVRYLMKNANMPGADLESLAASRATALILHRYGALTDSPAESAAVKQVVASFIRSSASFARCDKARP